MTKSKYPPILFNTEMVQAILENRKKQTRRVTNHPYFSKEELLEHTLPKYQIGDVLWVRETWQYLDIQEKWSDEIEDYIYKICYTYKASNDIRPDGIPPEEHHGNWVVSTKERYDNAEYSIESEEVEGRDIWKPSIHMPREAARIFLEVTNVRLERLQDISEADAVAEGINSQIMERNILYYEDYCISDALYSIIHRRFNYLNPINSFRSLWKKIDGKESWDKNPYVWVYEFERIEKPKDF